MQRIEFSDHALVRRGRATGRRGRATGRRDGHGDGVVAGGYGPNGSEPMVRDLPGGAGRDLEFARCPDCQTRHELAAALVAADPRMAGRLGQAQARHRVGGALDALGARGARLPATDAGADTLWALLEHLTVPGLSPRFSGAFAGPRSPPRHQHRRTVGAPDPGPASLDPRRLRPRPGQRFARDRAALRAGSPATESPR